MTLWLVCGSLDVAPLYSAMLSVEALPQELILSNTIIQYTSACAKKKPDTHCGNTKHQQTKAWNLACNLAQMYSTQNRQEEA